MLEFKESPEPDEFAREKGRKLFAGNVDFLKGVVDMNGLLPQIGLKYASQEDPTLANLH